MHRLKIVLVSFFVLALTNFVYAYDDGDFQVWNTDVEEFKISDEAKIAFEEEFRWGDNSEEFYYQHYDVGLFYNLNKYWNMGGGYRHIYELSKGKFKIENTPYLTATLSLAKRGFVFESRNRLEYRHFDFKADSGRYRNKFTLKFPWKFCKLQIQPFVSDEIFLGFGGTNQFNQNRLSSGIGMNLTKNRKTEVYYLLQSSKGSRGWSDANVFGTKLKILF